MSEIWTDTSTDFRHFLVSEIWTLKNQTLALECFYHKLLFVCLVKASFKRSVFRQCLKLEQSVNQRQPGCLISGLVWISDTHCSMYFQILITSVNYVLLMHF